MTRVCVLKGSSRRKDHSEHHKGGNARISEKIMGLNFWDHFQLQPLFEKYIWIACMCHRCSKHSKFIEIKIARNKQFGLVGAPHCCEVLGTKTLENPSPFGRWLFVLWGRREGVLFLFCFWEGKEEGSIHSAPFLQKRN